VLNVPNAVTIARIMLIPVFLVVLFSEIPHGDVWAVAVFALAAGTDKLDGYLARRRNSVTAAGMFLDPLADKLLISSALIALVSLNRVQAWVAMVIIGREFAVSGLRLVGVAQGVSIPASHMGKIKTASQTLAVLFLLVSYTAMPHYNLVENVLIYAAVALTLASGIEYFVNARTLLEKRPRPPEPGEGQAASREKP
jgi:CDP-diacylglycerol---glycerol-3-phosphate 3-phosphatidyltransferase